MSVDDPLLESLERQSNSIHRIQRIGLDSEELGHQIINDLGHQRETIIRVTQKLNSTDRNIDRSHSILNSMSRRATTNKVAMVLVVALLVAILIIILALKLRES